MDSVVRLKLQARFPTVGMGPKAETNIDLITIHATKPPVKAAMK